MNEMQVFTNEQFGQIRTTTINGEPWFVLKDVCAVFGESNYRRIVDRIEDDEKGVSQIETLGGKQSMIIINEYGVYSALFAMQPKKARGVSDEYTAERQRKVKQFKHWVTHDVLPSIRKHGMYATPQTIDNIINDPDFGIRLLTELKNEREKNSALTERNTALEQQIEQDKPFTDFGLAISTSEGSITVKQMAALLCQRGIKTGEKRLFEELRQDGFLLSAGGYYNEPAQRWMEQKLFEVRTSSYTNKYGNEQITRQSLITAKGIEYLMNYYLRKHGLMELLTVHRRQVTRQRGTRT